MDDHHSSHIPREKLGHTSVVHQTRQKSDEVNSCLFRKQCEKAIDQSWAGDWWDHLSNEMYLMQERLTVAFRSQTRLLVSYSSVIFPNLIQKWHRWSVGSFAFKNSMSVLHQTKPSEQGINSAW